MKYECVICWGKDNYIYNFLNTSYNVKEFGKLLWVDKLDFYVCKWCKTGFLLPLPNDDNLKKYYENEFDDLADMITKRNATIFEKQRLTNISKLVEKKGLWNKLFEIWTNIWVFLNHAKINWFEVSWIEPSSKAVNFAKNNYWIEINNNTFDFLEKFNEEFDVITSNHVFEHLKNPKKFLKLCCKWLKPWWILHIWVPNEIYTIDNLPIWRKLINKIYPQIRPTDHLFFYNYRSIKKIIEDNWFDVIFQKLDKWLLWYKNYPFPVFLKNKPKIFKYPLLFITFIYSMIATLTNSNDLIDIYAIKKWDPK